MVVDFPFANSLFPFVATPYRERITADKGLHFGKIYSTNFFSRKMLGDIAKR